jgi:hypothetical protein
MNKFKIIFIRGLTIITTIGIILGVCLSGNYCDEIYLEILFQNYQEKLYLDYLQANKISKLIHDSKLINEKLSESFETNLEKAKLEMQEVKQEKKTKLNFLYENKDKIILGIFILCALAISGYMIYHIYKSGAFTSLEHLDVNNRVNWRIEYKINENIAASMASPFEQSQIELWFNDAFDPNKFNYITLIEGSPRTLLTITNAEVTNLSDLDYKFWYIAWKDAHIMETALAKEVL